MNHYPRRRLLRRRDARPLYQRAEWLLFEEEMRARIARDVCEMLNGEDWEASHAKPTAHITRVLGWYESATIVDRNATQPLIPV